MIEETLFKIPYWTIPALNFSEKKKSLTTLLKGYPEKRHGMQTFATNRQSDRSNLAEAFANICGEELNMLTQKLKKDIQIEQFIIHYLLLKDKLLCYQSLLDTLLNQVNLLN